MHSKDLSSISDFCVLVSGANCTVSNIYCCDLLSCAMANMPENSVWFTVVNSPNTLAVASLSKTPVIVFCQNITPSAEIVSKGKELGITIVTTSLPSFEAAMLCAKYLFEE